MEENKGKGEVMALGSTRNLPFLLQWTEGTGEFVVSTKRSFLLIASTFFAKLTRY